MKIICIKEHPSITIGKIYNSIDIVNTNKNYWCLIRDDGLKNYYKKSLNLFIPYFEHLSNLITEILNDDVI